MRATQFFEFMLSIAHVNTQGQTVRLPAGKMQPIAADDVAQALARIATQPPVNGRCEIAGPDTFGLDELIRGVLRARHDPREVVTDPEARYFGARLNGDALTAGPDAWIGRISLERWLTTPVAA